MFELGTIFGALLMFFCFKWQLDTIEKDSKRFTDFWYQEYVKADKALWELRKKNMRVEGDEWKDA